MYNLLQMHSVPVSAANIQCVQVAQVRQRPTQTHTALCALGGVSAVQLPLLARTNLRRDAACLRPRLLHPCLAWVLSTGMDMGALTAPQCTAPFKRQRSASPPSLPQGLYRAHCPGLAGRLTKAEAQMSTVEKAPWCTVPRLSSMAQHLSHLLAPNLPCSAPPRPVPSSRLSYIHTMYIKVLLQHFIFLPHTHACVCLCVWRALLQAHGPWSQPSHSVRLAALSTLSVHLSLCSALPPSSCSPSRPISQPSTRS